ncbi:MAG TPA: hypothetical protein PK031_03990 [Pseudomonadales bacterium]|nr:hypothetical protein [Pseudomonadales bacterium]
MTNQRSEIQEILRSLPWPVWLFAAAWIMLAVYWQWLVHVDGIFGEMWDTLPAYQLLGEMSITEIARELLRKYALVHIIALPKLGFWIDFHFFGATGRFTHAASFFVLILCFFCAAYIAIRDYQRPITCVVLALLLFFNGFQTFVVNWESLLQYYLAVFFALLAFIAYDRSPGRLFPPVVLLLLSALSCGASIAAIAGFSFMLLVRAVYGVKVPRPALAGYAIFLLAMALLLNPDAADSFILQDPKPFFWNAPNLLLQYLAYPFSAWGDFRWLGFIMLLAVAHSVCRCVIWRTGTLSDYVFCYFFLIACTIALGRYKLMGIDGDVSRYYVYIAPLWYFSILKLLPLSVRLFRVTSAAVCMFLLAGSLASVIVTANMGQKMALARTVALNGNFQHFASQRLDALKGLPANLENSSAYLRANQMDIYYRLEEHIEPDAADCHAKLLRQSGTTKGTFVDYVLQENQAIQQTAAPLSSLYLANDDGKILFYGTAFAAVTHLQGWGISLRDVRVSDWPLLLPLAWLSGEQRQLFIHLPRSVPLNSLSAWAKDTQGNWCRLTVSASL